MVTGMGKHLDAKITNRRINLQGNAAKRSMKASTTDSSATRRRVNWDALKRSSKRWISLQTKNHHEATRAEINVYRSKWWIRSNVVNFDTMPTRHQPDFKKALYGGREAICKVVTKFLFMVTMTHKLVGVRLRIHHKDGVTTD